jgi:hypothetical protein
VRVLLDQLRRKLAINTAALQETRQQQIQRRAEQLLNEFWGLDPEIREMRTAEQFVLKGVSAREIDGFSLGDRSALGRYYQSRLSVPASQ